MTELSPPRPLPILNIAAYRFVRLEDLGRRRRELREFCRGHRLRGTILLSPEGINLFVAGHDHAIEALLTKLRSEPKLADLEVKRSRSVEPPFRRMLVKVKNEIISLGVPGLDPIEAPAEKIQATELKRWLDEGRPVRLLDVRNDYEVELGTFSHAMPIGVDHFRHFPRAVENLPAAMKDDTIVMFCTGGIRCEKAGPLMRRAGFKHVLQLEGGILKYFEECGGDHYEGECFVFDQRVALDSNLRETDTTLCFACQSALTIQDQASPKYVVAHSCPHCYRPAEQQLREQIEQRHAKIRVVTSPLPGSLPYENRRPLNVPRRCDGLQLLEMLSTLHPHVDPAQWCRWCEAGEIQRAGKPLAATDIVRAGERIEHVEPETVEPDVNAAIQIIHEDAMLVVVNKPAPLPMHPSGRFHRNTLSFILDKVYAPQRLRIAHRLDANTTGVAVLSRTKNVAARVQPQFEHGRVIKQYIARVHGVPSTAKFTCEAAISSRPLQAGARTAVESGLAARTNFELLVTFADHTSLVLARPITGRTNQIRLHLAHLGFPIVGDPLYLGDGIGDRQTLAPDDAPLCLHAWRLDLSHPEDERQVRFEAATPSWVPEGSLAGQD